MNGRLEILVDGQWGTVCDDRFDTDYNEENAMVICRELGLSGGRAFVDAEYGQGSDSQPILLDDLRCNGDESSISACEHRDVREHNCGHDEDVGIGKLILTLNCNLPSYYLHCTLFRQI